MNEVIVAVEVIILVTRKERLRHRQAQIWIVIRRNDLGQVMTLELILKSLDCTVKERLQVHQVHVTQRMTRIRTVAINQAMNRTIMTLTF